MVTWAVCWLAGLTIRHWTAATKGNGLRSTLQPLPLLPILLGGCSTVGRVEGREQDRLYFRAPGARARIEPRIKWSSCRGAVEMNRPFSKLKFDHWQLDGGSELEVRCWDDSHRGEESSEGYYISSHTSEIILTEFPGNVYFSRLLYLSQQRLLYLIL